MGLLDPPAGFLGLNGPAAAAVVTGAAVSVPLVEATGAAVEVERSNVAA